MEEYDVIILGAGPAGLTSAIYTCRAGLKTLVIDEKNAGGQILISAKVENYPGFSSISGAQLMEKIKNQAISFGAKIIEYNPIIKVELEKKTIFTMNGTYKAKAIIIATGTKHKSLNIPNEEKFKGRGISYCSTCDGPFYKNKKILVIGGGNSALEEAIYLTKFAKKVIIMYRSKIKAEKFIIDKAKNNKKITFIKGVPIRFEGKEKLEKIIYKHDNIIKEMEIDGAFIYIGATPNSYFNELKLDEKGYIITDKECGTSIKGVYAVGDVTNNQVKQLAVAVGDGAKAGANVYKYLEKIK